MNDRRAKWLSWALWAVAVSLTAGSLVLLALISAHPGVPVFDWWFGNTTVVVEATLGAILASRRPENLVGWMISGFAVCVSTSSFTAQYAIYALLVRPGELPLGEAVAWICAWQLPLIIGFQLSYMLLFPTGHLPGRLWRFLAYSVVVFVVVGVFLAAFAPDPYLGSLGEIRNPLGVAGLDAVYEAFAFTAAPVLFVAVAASIFARLRQATGVERQQIKWFAYAAVILAIGTAFNVLSLIVDGPPWFEVGTLVVFSVAGLTVPIAIGIAILKHRLYDIDRIINKTLVYGSLTISLIGMYLASVVSLQYAFRFVTGGESQIIIVASTLMIAALFNPVRRRIQTFVDRRFYRSKYDARRILDDFARQLRDETDLTTLTGDLVSVARETVQPSHVSLWLRGTGESMERGEG